MAPGEVQRRPPTGMAPGEVQRQPPTGMAPGEVQRRPPVVVVRGEAQREVPPDQAVITVTATSRDRDRETVLRRLAERAAEVRLILQAFPVERREAGPVQVYPELKRGGERVIAYTGSLVTTVTVTEFDRLGDLLLRLAGLSHASVAGPSWQLSPGSRVGAEVRKAAIGDALLRAREYAEAVGARIDRLIEIADEGIVQHFAMRASAGPEIDIEVDPQPQIVQASVTVRVTITEPTLPS
jgi:uncharacterized protein